MSSAALPLAEPHFRGLILDFGGVIAKSFFETRAEFEKMLGVAEGSLSWRGPFDVTLDRRWQKVLAGAITESDYWLQCAEETGALIGERWTFEHFCHRQSELPLERVVRSEAEALVTQAKQRGLRVAVLTNELESLTGLAWIKKISVLRHLDAFLDATHTHIRKPDPRAYRLALDAIDLPAEQAVFLDDQLKNAEGAEAVGLRAVCLDIRDPKAAFKRVSDLLDIAG